MFTHIEALPYNYFWNWKPRMGEKNRKGMRCRLLVCGRAMNSCLVELEDGEWVVCSRNVLRRSK